MQSVLCRRRFEGELKHLPLEMFVLRRLFELLEGVFGRRARVRHIVLDLEHSPIYKLPPELIILIADYLSTESGASLSLACCSFYSYLAKQCLVSLKAEYSTMNRFLHFLEPDLPTHIVCPHCNQLHSIFFAKNHHLPYRLDDRISKP